jgi:hypothetical protein
LGFITTVKSKVQQPGEGLQGLQGEAGLIWGQQLHVSKLKVGELLQLLQHACGELDIQWPPRRVDAEVLQPSRQLPQQWCQRRSRCIVCQPAFPESQLLEGCQPSAPEHVLQAVTLPELQHAQLQAAQLQLLWQQRAKNGGIMNVSFELYADAVDVLVVLADKHQHTVYLLLSGHDSCDAAECQRSSLVQPAVGPGCIEQAALIISCTALQHCQQA